MQVIPLRLDFDNSIPLHWDEMEGTPEVSGSRFIVTPTLTIIISGISPPNMSNQTFGVIHSTISASINIFVPLIVGSTHISSVPMSLPSITNAFSFSMPSMDMLNAITGSQSTSQVSNVGLGNSLIPYKVVPWGGAHIPLSFPSFNCEAFPSSIPNPFRGWGTSMGGGLQYFIIPST
jgi:hypothetical protein